MAIFILKRLIEWSLVDNILRAHQWYLLFSLASAHHSQSKWKHCLNEFNLIGPYWCSLSKRKHFISLTSFPHLFLWSKFSIKFEVQQSLIYINRAIIYHELSCKNSRTLPIRMQAHSQWMQNETNCKKFVFTIYAVLDNKKK